MTAPTGDRAQQIWAGIALAAIGAAAFSGKAILAKLMYRHGADAVLVITLRMLIALPVFAAMAWWAGRNGPRLTVREWLVVALLGFTGYYAASYLDFIGLQYIGVNLERLILYLNPTIVLLIGVLFLGRKVTGRQMLAVAVSYVGVLVVYGHEVSVQGDGLALGTALVFGSALSYAVYLIFSGETVRRLGSLRLAGLASTVACVLCLLTFAAIRPLEALAAPAPVLWLSLLNATACTVAPVLMVMMAVERIGPTLAAQAGMVGPVCTVLLSVLVLDEPFTPLLAAGTLVVLVGIWLLTRWR